MIGAASIGTIGAVPGRRGFLLVRRGGGLWGIASAAVESLTRRDGTFRIEVAEGTILADEIVGVVEELAVQPAAQVLRRFWKEAPAGLAVHGVLPLVVVDPRQPPHALRSLEEGAPDGVPDEGRV